MEQVRDSQIHKVPTSFPPRGNPLWNYEVNRYLILKRNP